MDTSEQETRELEEDLGIAASSATQERPPTPHSTPSERAARGKAAREEAPRAGQLELDTSGDRDAVALLEAQSASRVPELVPIRYGRMLASPFAFYRGSATVMTQDLARTPSPGIHAQLCGDAHLTNFGAFASPSRDLVFDMNDFDETLPGPFEWDVKRLATSFEICARDRDFTDATRRGAVLGAVRAYREAMRHFAGLGNLAVWYSRLTAAEIEAALLSGRNKKQVENVKRAVEKAHRKDHLKALDKLTHEVDGEPRFVSDPPLIVPLAELADGADLDKLTASILDLYRAYGETLQSDRRALLQDYRYADMARKVVGVGSVGTRSWVILLIGRDGGDPLLLQVKEAQQSVLESVLGPSDVPNHGQRVVQGQRLMQSSSDIFLGWIHNAGGLDGVDRHFYVRQLWDWKTSVDTTTILPRGLELYAEFCGRTLARAHARSGDRIAIASYLGKNDVFDRAIADFAAAYADVNERDYKALEQAARDGRIEVQAGV